MLYSICFFAFSREQYTRAELDALTSYERFALASRLAESDPAAVRIFPTAKDLRGAVLGGEWSARGSWVYSHDLNTGDGHCVSLA